MASRRLLNGKSGSGLIVAALFILPDGLVAQNREIKISAGWAEDAPILTSLVEFAHTESDLRVAVTRYVADKASIERRYEVRYSIGYAATSRRHMSRRYSRVVW